MHKPYSGKFKIKNKEKYIGDYDNVWYRSSWECYFMSWLDKTDEIINWKSEEIAIPYISPVDGKYHRYFVDFWIKMKTKNGIQEFLVEIKPAAQVAKPEPPKKVTKQYKQKVLTWITNKQKWEAAISYAENNGMHFKILTEKELGLDYKYKNEKNITSPPTRRKSIPKS